MNTTDLPNTAGARPALDLAACSVPVSSLDKLLTAWKARKAAAWSDVIDAEEKEEIPESRLAWRAVAEIQACIEELRAEMEAAKKRQPEENAPDQRTR